MVRAGDLVEVWDYIDTGVKTGIVPPRRAKGQRERSEAMLKRARQSIRYLVSCNSTVGNSYFFTATFADNVRDYGAAVVVWEKFKRILSREFPEMAYVVVPELQKRGAWHFHAVFFNMPPVPVLIEKYGKMVNSRGMTVDRWQFFFTELWTRANGTEVINRASISLCRHPQALSRYVSKYLTKETGTAVPADRKCYFSGGKNLKRPTIIKYNCFMFRQYGFPPDSCMEPLPEKNPVFAISYRSEYCGRISFYRWDLSPDYNSVLVP